MGAQNCIFYFQFLRKWGLSAHIFFAFLTKIVPTRKIILNNLLIAENSVGNLPTKTEPPGLTWGAVSFYPNSKVGVVLVQGYVLVGNVLSSWMRSNYIKLS